MYELLNRLIVVLAWSLAIVVTGAVTALSQAAVTTRIREDFDCDLCWEGRNNVPPSSTGVTETQDFGYSQTGHAGAKMVKTGDLVWQIESTQPQKALQYSIPIGQFSCKDILESSDRLCLKRVTPDSAIVHGYEVLILFDQSLRKCDAAFDRLGFLSWPQGSKFIESFFRRPSIYGTD